MTTWKCMRVGLFSLLSSLKTVLKRSNWLIIGSFVALVLSLVLLQYYLHEPTSGLNVQCDFQVFDYAFQGRGNIGGITANSFLFIADESNVTTLSMGSEIESLSISDAFDNLILNTSGVVDLVITNSSLLFLELSDGSLGTLETFYGLWHYPNISSALNWRADLPNPSLYVEFLERKSEVTITIPSGRHFLTFFATLHEGNLVVKGDYNSTIEQPGLIYVDMWLHVPPTLSYEIWIRMISEKPSTSNVYLKGWHVALFNLLSDIECNVLLEYAKGEIAYEGRSLETSGSFLELQGFYGTVQIMSTSTPNIQRVIIGGDVDSVVLKSARGERRGELFARSLLDHILFPGIFASVFVLAVAFRIRARFGRYKIVGVGVPPTLILFSTLIAWAVHTDQPTWVQIILGQLPLYITIILHVSDNVSAHPKE